MYDACSRLLYGLLVTTTYTSQCLNWMDWVLLIMNIGDSVSQLYQCKRQTLIDKERMMVRLVPLVFFNIMQLCALLLHLALFAVEGISPSMNEED